MKFFSRTTLTIFLLCLTVILSACGTQTTAPITTTYEGLSVFKTETNNTDGFGIFSVDCESCIVNIYRTETMSNPLIPSDGMSITKDGIAVEIINYEVLQKENVRGLWTIKVLDRHQDSDNPFRLGSLVFVVTMNDGGTITELP